MNTSCGWNHAWRRDGRSGRQHQDPKRNEYLVEWDVLPDEIKTIDRDLVEGIPDILAAAGYTAIKIGSS
jgi:hypothetical protein